MAQLDLFCLLRRPWNSGRMLGPKPPLQAEARLTVVHASVGAQALDMLTL